MWFQVEQGSLMLFQIEIISLLLLWVEMGSPMSILLQIRYFSIVGENRKESRWDLTWWWWWFYSRWLYLLLDIGWKPNSPLWWWCGLRWTSLWFFFFFFFFRSILFNWWSKGEIWWDGCFVDIVEMNVTLFDLYSSRVWKVDLPYNRLWIHLLSWDDMR